jgi:hypothetical protein
MRFIPSPLLVLNYYIYSFYQRWEPDPVSYGVQITSLLLTINLIEATYILNGFDLAFTRGREALIVPVTIFISIVNYLLIYRKGKYRAYFASIAQRKSEEQKWLGAAFAGYFSATVLPVAGMLAAKIIRG